MENWEQDLKNTIDDVSNNIKFKNMIRKDYLLYIYLTLMSLALLFALEYRTGWLSSKFQKKVISQQKEVLEPANKSFQSEIEILEQKIVDLEIANKELQKQLLWNSQRIGLMGIMLNENFNIIKNNNSKDNIIFLGRDWKLSAMPKNLNLTEDDKKIIIEFLEANQ